MPAVEVGNRYMPAARGRRQTDSTHKQPAEVADASRKITTHRPLRDKIRGRQTCRQATRPTQSIHRPRNPQLGSRLAHSVMHGRHEQLSTFLPYAGNLDAKEGLIPCEVSLASPKVVYALAPFNEIWVRQPPRGQPACGVARSCKSLKSIDALVCTESD